MEQVGDFFSILLNSEKLIHYGGLALLLIIIFAETGLVIGFIFPGDALLFTAGLLCGSDELDVNIFLLVFSVAVAAFIGNITGYFTGNYFGHKLFQKKDSLFFRQKHLEKAKGYYEKYGGVALIGGRFLPVIRTFVPILAGAIDLNFWKFNVYNVTGAVIWSGSLIPLGYFVGIQIPASVDHIEYIVLGITAITMTIFIRSLFRMKNEMKNNK